MDPNPLIETNRSSTANVVIKEKADFGVAFDGDFDRCFIFDNRGDFISGEYIVGLFTEVFLDREKYAKIVHDPALFGTFKILYLNMEVRLLHLRLVMLL